MTAEEQAVVLVNEVRAEREQELWKGVGDRRGYGIVLEALCRAIERLRVEAQAQYDRGYYDGIFTHPLEQSDALRDQLLQECLVKLRDVQGTEAPKQYACNLIKRIERVLQEQNK